MALIKSCKASAAGVPDLIQSYELDGTGTKTFSADVGDYIILQTWAGGSNFDFNGIFGTVTGAEVVDFWGPDGASVAVTGLVRATATTVSFNYTNPNKGVAVKYKIS